MEPPKYTDAEQAIIDLLRKHWGRPLTPGEINLQLAFGEVGSWSRPDRLRRRRIDLGNAGAAG